jgi:Spy/CpxP family protein refolding chaperone
MKILNRTMAALFVGTLALSPALKADSKHGKEDSKSCGRIEHLKMALDLSDSQAAKLKDLEMKDREEAKILKDKVEADRAQLKVLVDQKAADSALSAGLKTLETDQKALRSKVEERFEAAKEILTPLQQAKFAVMFGGKGHRGWGSEGGWGRGHGPDGPKQCPFEKGGKGAPHDEE